MSLGLHINVFYRAEWAKASGRLISRLVYFKGSFLLDAQRFEARDDVEQLRVDATLAQAVKRPV